MTASWYQNICWCCRNTSKDQRIQIVKLLKMGKPVSSCLFLRFSKQEFSFFFPFPFGVLTSLRGQMMRIGALIMSTELTIWWGSWSSVKLISLHTQTLDPSWPKETVLNLGPNHSVGKHLLRHWLNWFEHFYWQGTSWLCLIEIDQMFRNTLHFPLILS